MEKNLTDEPFFVIMQFFREEKYEESLHNLEKEWGKFFNWKHFEDLVVAGNWDEVESYLSAFTKVAENQYSMKMFFNIRKQKYLEALDRHDRHGALDILTKDLKVFESYNKETFKEITNLITLENFSENSKLTGYCDTKSARGIVLGELKKLAKMNPSTRQKLDFPNIETSRLRTNRPPIINVYVRRGERRNRRELEDAANRPPIIHVYFRSGKRRNRRELEHAANRPPIIHVYVRRGKRRNRRELEDAANRPPIKHVYVRRGNRRELEDAELAKEMEESVSSV